MTTSPTTRYGWVQEHRVLLDAAVLAADAAQRPGQGFAAADVRFYFLLFTNWIERDLLHPEQDVELTQIRRVVERLVHTGWAARVRGAKKARHVLLAPGVEGLAAALGDAVDAGRPFEEMLFVVSFASSYGARVRARIAAAPNVRAAPARVAALLDPRSLVLRARRRTRALLADLEDRIASGLAMAAEAAREGDDADVIRRMEARGSYQLHRVRPLGDVLRALPADVRRFELEAGIALRVRLLFEPLAARARAEIAALEGIEARIARKL